MGKLAENLSNNFIPGSSLLGKFVANLLLLDEQKESKVKVDTLGNQLVALEDFLRGNQSTCSRSTWSARSAKS